jgi:phosphoribosylglycinamide formyltransferase-1
MMRIAIFASGSGSNFQAIVDAVKQGELPVEISCLVCDQPEAYVLERARREQIPSLLLRLKDFENKAAYEEAILGHLRGLKVDAIVLAGYMKLVGPTLLSAFAGKIVNIHPSLLPAFPGKDAIGDALEYGVRVTGITIHYVDDGVDTGPIITQAVVPIIHGEDRESLAHRIHREEHRWYPEVIRWMAEGKVRLDGRKVEIAE